MSGGNVGGGNERVRNEELRVGGEVMSGQLILFIMDCVGISYIPHTKPPPINQKALSISPKKYSIHAISFHPNHKQMKARVSMHKGDSIAFNEDKSNSYAQMNRNMHSSSQTCILTYAVL